MHLHSILSQLWGDFLINVIQALLEGWDFLSHFFCVLLLVLLGIKMASH